MRAGQTAAGTGPSSTVRSSTSHLRSEAPKPIIGQLFARVLLYLQCFVARAALDGPADSTSVSICTDGRIRNWACDCARRASDGGSRGTAAIWHVKPPRENTLEVETRKAFEKAADGAPIPRKTPSEAGRGWRPARTALNACGRSISARRTPRVYAGVAKADRAPAWIQIVRASSASSTGSTRASWFAQSPSLGRKREPRAGVLRGRRDRRFAGSDDRRSRAAATFCTVDALTLAAHRETLKRVPDIEAVLVDDGGDERVLASRWQSSAYDACVDNLGYLAHGARGASGENPGARRPGAAAVLVSFYHRVARAQRRRRRDVTLVGHPARLRPGDRLRHERSVDTGSCRRRGRARSRARSPTTLGLALSSVPGNFVIVNPCNAIASKVGRWPTEGWVALAAALRERAGMRVLISGGPHDAQSRRRSPSKAARK